MGITDEKITEVRKQFEQIGTATGQAHGIKVTKTAFSKIKTETIIEATRSAAFEAAEKYATKAREFCKMAVKIAEDAGGKAGAEAGELEGMEKGEEEGGNVGEQVGKEAGEKSGMEVGGEEGAKVGSIAGAKAGRKFGLTVGKAAGIKAGQSFGKTAGREAGAKIGLSEAMKMFKIGISKERVMSLKQHFVTVGRTEGSAAGKAIGLIEGVKAAREEAMKFCYEEGAKAGAAAARKRRAANEKAFGEEGQKIGEDEGGKAGAEAGAKAKTAGNLGDLLPKKMSTATRGRLSHEDTMNLNLEFESDEKASVEEDVDQTAKWATVVFSDLPDEKKKEKKTSPKDNVNSLKAKFETSKMKNNEAYVIM